MFRVKERLLGDLRVCSCEFSFDELMSSGMLFVLMNACVLDSYEKGFFWVSFFLGWILSIGC